MPSKAWIAWCNIWLALIMSVILSICFTVGQGYHLTIEGFGYTFAVAFIISLIVAFFAQLPRIGSWYGKQMGRESHTVISYLSESAIQVTFFLVVVNLFMALALTGLGDIGGMSLFDRWWAMNMKFWSVAYIAFLITRPLAEGLATKITIGKTSESKSQMPVL